MTNDECRMTNVARLDRSAQLRVRTKTFAVRVIRLVASLPNSTASRAIASQLVRSATSIGANYRSAAKAKSRADFISKIGIVEEEADETVYWIELLIEADLVSAEKVSTLLREAEEITSIMAASRLTAKRNGKQPP